MEQQSNIRKVNIPKETIESLYLQGNTMSQIADKLGVTKRVIQLRMQEHAIPRRKATGKNHGKWKGGRLNKYGYTKIWMPDHPRANNVGYVSEHMLVMEKELKRKISREEHIHHIDFGRSNNNPENLWVCSDSTHKKAERSIQKLIKGLLEDKIINFNREKGRYERTA